VYRPAIGPDRAREELLSCAGTQFSQPVVDALLRILDSKRIPVS
jgi:HD-GYP domain-containing protein (c-di-GMP phosphodiesterase class II)